MSLLYEFLAEPAELARHDHDEAFASLLARLRALTGREPTTWRVLDLGCGFTYPNVLLLGALGADVTGADVLEGFARDGAGALAGVWRRQGVSAARALPKACRQKLRAALYHRQLARRAGRRLPRDVRLASYDGLHLPFPDAAFDAVTSTAVLEHVADLDAFAREVARVLRPGGVADMLWHNYYALSGNHLPDDLCRAYPWGHLSGTLPPLSPALARNHPFLNRATPAVIEAAFARSLRIARIVGADAAHRLAGEAGFSYEGEDLLTPELARQLAAHPRELLLTRAYLLQARKS